MSLVEKIVREFYFWLNIQKLESLSNRGLESWINHPNLDNDELTVLLVAYNGDIVSEIKKHYGSKISNLIRPSTELAHRAAFAGNIALLDYIKHNNKDSDIFTRSLWINGQYKTVVHYALKSQNSSVVEWLIKHSRDCFYNLSKEISYLNKDLLEILDRFLIINWGIDAISSDFINSALSVGNIEVLQYIRKNYPYLYYKEDSLGPQIIIGALSLRGTLSEFEYILEPREDIEHFFINIDSWLHFVFDVDGASEILVQRINKLPEESKGELSYAIKQAIENNPKIINTDHKALSAARLSYLLNLKTPDLLVKISQLLQSVLSTHHTYSEIGLKLKNSASFADFISQANLDDCKLLIKSGAKIHGWVLKLPLLLLEQCSALTQHDKKTILLMEAFEGSNLLIASMRFSPGLLHSLLKIVNSLDDDNKTSVLTASINVKTIYSLTYQYRYCQYPNLLRYAIQHHGKLLPLLLKSIDDSIKVRLLTNQSELRFVLRYRQELLVLLIRDLLTFERDYRLKVLMHIDQDGDSLLLLSIKTQNKMELVSLLLQGLNCDEKIKVLSQKNNAQDNAFMLALDRKSLSAVKLLIDEIQELDSKHKLTVLGAKNKDGYNAIMLTAAQGGDLALQCIDLLNPEQQSVILQEKNKNGFTALALVIYHGLTPHGRYSLFESLFERVNNLEDNTAKKLILQSGLDVSNSVLEEAREFNPEEATLLNNVISLISKSILNLEVSMHFKRISDDDIPASWVLDYFSLAAKQFTQGAAYNYFNKLQKKGTPLSVALILKPFYKNNQLRSDSDTLMKVFARLFKSQETLKPLQNPSPQKTLFFRSKQAIANKLTHQVIYEIAMKNRTLDHKKLADLLKEQYSRCLFLNTSSSVASSEITGVGNAVTDDQQFRL